MTAQQPQAKPWAVGGLGLGQLVALVGGALIVIGSVLDWAGRNFPKSFGGFDVPAKFIVDSESNLDGSGVPVGVLALLIGAVAIVGAVVPRLSVLVWVGGAAAVVVAVLFAIQLNDFMDRANKLVLPGGFGVRNTVGFGALLCGLGGLVVLVGAALPFAQRWLAARPEAESTSS